MHEESFMKKKKSKKKKLAKEFDHKKQAKMFVKNMVKIKNRSSQQ